MPQITIKYKNKRTLQALKDFAKYFDFSIVSPNKNTTTNFQINGVTMVPANDSIDIKEMDGIFSNKNLDSKQLRQDAWQRAK